MIHTDPLPSPGSTLVIEASAGTGKTWTISTLAARFIAETETKISQMAIVTFSVAATAEVKQRTQQCLVNCAEALLESEPPTDSSVLAVWCEDPQERELRRSRLIQAIDDCDLAPIMTTHGFCDRLLSLMGVMADHDTHDQLIPDLNDLAAQVTADHYLRLRNDKKPWFTYDQALSWVRESLFAPSASIHPSDREETHFVEAARSTVEQRKRALGVYTFDDMMLRCRDALRHDTSGEVQARLSQTYPVLLVDEFQDTDLIQWEIIRTGFVDHSTVILIGDPKQSIYGFRGAEVSAYLRATQIAEIKTLDTNYRSSPSVVNAVGSIMNGAELGDELITVKPVLTCNQTPSLICGAPWNIPLRLRVPRDLEPLSAGAAREVIDTDLSDDLMRLLDSQILYRSSDESVPQPLKPQDIAIIVSTNVRGNAILDHLLSQGIPGVFTGTDSVFLTPAAQDWLRLMKALSTGTSAQIRAASLTSLIGWDLDRLVHANSDEFSELVSMIRGLSTLLVRGSPMSVLEWLMDRTDLVDRLSHDVAGERTLMDLKHVAQLLSAPHPGLVPPADWLLARCRSQPGRDEATRRLPTHCDAIRILTVHQAKGLQFPVVYLPQIADRYDSLKEEPVVAHDEHGERIMDLGISDPESPIRDQARLESAQESLRACYVALTRSSAHITTWWVPTKRNTAPSALHRLLFRTSAGPPAQIPVTGHNPHRLSLPGVVVEEIPVQREIPQIYLPADQPRSLSTQKPVLSRIFDSSWRRTSFSSLTAAAHEHPPDTDEGEDLEVDIAVHDDPELEQRSPMADLPSGTGFGSLVHTVFEYANPDGSDLLDWISTAMGESGYSGFSAETLATSLRPALETPLGPIADGLTLSQIPCEDRLAELDFELPLSSGNEAARLSTISECLRGHLDSTSSLAAYPDALTDDLDPRALRGYLTGSIDAVIRLGGRYLIVDYKTNRLAPPDSDLTLRHYTRPAMAQAMISSHYPLQALLYSVALHRFLRWRLTNYDPATHLGGIAYLFVRGMAGPTTPVRDGTVCGVFSWQPGSALIEELSDLLSGVTR